MESKNLSLDMKSLQKAMRPNIRKRIQYALSGQWQHWWGLICARFGYCYHHGWGHKVERFRMNTAYVEEACNYSYGCELCQQDSKEYWDERWRDYYSSIM